MSGFCQLCGRRIQRDSLLYHHPLWPEGRNLRVCGDCDRRLPRCARCGIPTADGGNLCATCQASAPRCLTCGRTITGQYYEINDKGPYCADCHHNRPICDTCGAPLGEAQWLLSDGRTACGDCHATAIYEQPAAVQEYERITSRVCGLLGLALNVATPVVLVDRNQLVDVASQQNLPGAAGWERMLGLYARLGMRRGIYMQTGLPRSLFIQVAAHEYAHAWQGENCPLLSDPLVREGFAEWVAYKTLEHYGLEKQRQRMLQRADLYGEGLKWAIALEKAGGLPAVIEACRAAR